MKLSLRTFIEVLRTGRGPTTRALDAIFTPPYAGSGFEEVQEEGALDSPLADWGVQLMLDAGAGIAEILHINSWPDELKESLRAEVLRPAVEQGLKVRFFWEGHAGSDAEWILREPATAGDVDVVFRTAWSKVQQTSVEEVEVAVS